MSVEMPKVLKVKKIINEASGIKSFLFDHSLGARPGQFVNVWLPGVDEKPMGISYHEKNLFGITASKVGPFSSAMHELKAGDRVGFRGPYGNGFSIEGKRIALVGGGYGAASLAFLAEEAAGKGIDVTFIIGARTENLLLFRDRFRGSRIKTVYCTDDGSYGERGFTTQMLEKILAGGRVDKVFTVGPEMMMKAVADACLRANVKGEASLERYMKCGFGVCGSCSVDPSGVRVCREGTVFPFDRLSYISEFGKYHRDGSGKRVMF